MAAFLVGVLVAALLIPDHRSPNADTLSSGGSGTVSATQGSGSGPQTAPTAGPSQSAASGPSQGTPSALGSSAASTGSSTSSAAASASSTSGFSGKNSGASAQGVSATTIKLGVLGGSSSTIGAVCPRCSQGGQATDEAIAKGLIALWTKEHKLPVYGRTLSPVFGEANDLDQTGASSQSACEKIGQQSPFASFTAIEAGGDDCLVQTYHSFVFDSGGGDTQPGLNLLHPYFWEVGSSIEQALTSWVSWANTKGLLKGHTLGLFAPDDSYDSGIQEVFKATFDVKLAKLGYHLAVNYAYSGSSGSDDSVAAAKMKAAGVDVVFMWSALTEPAGFQRAANNIGYHPLYPIVDAGNSPYDDALADVAYNSTYENNNLGLATRWWDWSARSPAVAHDNPAAQECVDAYEQETGKTLDVYNDDALLRYILDECSDMQAILQGLQNAGPDLTKDSFVSGLEKIQDLQTAEYESVSFTRGPLEPGANDFQTAKFNASRWQPSNDYWAMTGPYTPWTTFPGDAAIIAEAVKEGE